MEKRIRGYAGNTGSAEMEVITQKPSKWRGGGREQKSEQHSEERATGDAGVSDRDGLMDAGWE